LLRRLHIRETGCVTSANGLALRSRSAGIERSGLRPASSGRPRRILVVRCRRPRARPGRGPGQRTLAVRRGGCSPGVSLHVPRTIRPRAGAYRPAMSRSSWRASPSSSLPIARVSSSSIVIGPASSSSHTKAAAAMCLQKRRSVRRNCGQVHTLPVSEGVTLTSYRWSVPSTIAQKSSPSNAVCMTRPRESSSLARSISRASAARLSTSFLWNMPSLSPRSCSRASVQGRGLGHSLQR